jgi:nucleoside-diphosphate-sugar epimerase
MAEDRGGNILVVGATGFLGPALVEELSIAGFKVICGVRNLDKAARQLPFASVQFLKVDLNTDLRPEIWLARLKEYDIDKVVNNVGIANSFGGQSLDNVNIHAPMALFEAVRRHYREHVFSAEESITPRIIQISTTGVDWPDCDQFPYPASKRLLEEQLSRMSDLPHIIIRPNVIYEPERGHLLLEQIARIPIIFYIGHEKIQPVHCREIAIGVVRLLTRKEPPKHSLLRATGPIPMTWKEVFETSSAELNRNHICYCPVPLKMAQLVTILIQKLPDKLLYRLGILSKMDPDTMLMMTRGSTGSNKEWLQATGVRSIRLDETYREYEKGPEAYASFIESIRNSINVKASQQKG